jgi:phage FluMu protein gp41
MPSLLLTMKRFVPAGAGSINAPLSHAFVKQLTQRTLADLLLKATLDNA